MHCALCTVHYFNLPCVERKICVSLTQFLALFKLISLINLCAIILTKTFSKNQPAQFHRHLSYKYLSNLDNNDMALWFLGK